MSTDVRLGDCVVRPQRRLIERGGESVHVKPKSMAVLECLVAAGGQPVSRNQLFDMVWPRAEVTDDTLTKCIVELRKAFGDTARDSRVIETIPKTGFRLVPPAEPLDEIQLPAQISAPRRKRWLRHRSTRLLLVAVVLILGTLLFSVSSRIWLTEAGVTALLEGAAMLVPYTLERKPGIAVLPFVNNSNDTENEYFSDGVSAEVLNALARSNRLPVIARTSSFQFKGQNRDVREIGRRLGVTHVLEGSVRKAGKSIRVTVQLIDAATGEGIWSGAYQRELSDIFLLQNEIAQNIVDQIDAVIGDGNVPLPGIGPASGFMKSHPTANLEAYDLYLKGVEMVTSDRPALIEQAAGYFDRAIALDSGYADAWAAKGFALALLGEVGSGSSRIPAAVYPDAIAALRRALEIEPGHAFATGWLGVVLMANDFEWAEGMQLLKKSLALNPSDAALLAIYGFYMDLMHIDGADEVVERAYRLDPFGFEPVLDRAIHLARKGRLLDAASLLETSLIEDREGYAPNYFTAGYNLALGRLDLAQERISKARLVANPVDLNLDALQWLIDNRRGKGPLPPFAEVWQRMQTEKLSGAVLWDGWKTEEDIVAVFELAIKQRIPALRTALFGTKPALMPEAVWTRMKEITGVTQFQATL